MLRDNLFAFASGSEDRFIITRKKSHSSQHGFAQKAWLHTTCGRSRLTVTHSTRGIQISGEGS